MCVGQLVLSQKLPDLDVKESSDLSTTTILCQTVCPTLSATATMFFALGMVYVTACAMLGNRIFGKNFLTTAAMLFADQRNIAT